MSNVGMKEKKVKKIIHISDSTQCCTLILHHESKGTFSAGFFT